MSTHSHQPDGSEVAEAASSWLARRDRGLTAAEQDEFLLWLQADPRHSESFAQHAAALERMMHLHEWQPAHTTEPNPDLFATGRRRRWRGWIVGVAAAAAAAIALAAWQLLPFRGAAGGTPQRLVERPAAPKSFLRVNERLALPDGSRVELKDGSHVVVQYSATERRVKLDSGEAHFSVWKDSQRPFIVDAAGLEVHAVGTAFDVRLEAHAVEVLVTEGRVKVEKQAGSGGATLVPIVNVGERARVPRISAAEQAPPAEVVPVTSDEIRQILSWQAPRLQFNETPLADAVLAFNRLNRRQLVIDDAAIAGIPIGGTFRPDNVDGFVRLLNTTLGVRAEAAGDNRTLLRRGN